MSRRRLNPVRIAMLLGVLLALLRVAQFGFLELLDVRAVDYRLLQRDVQPGAPEVVIVGVDDASIEELGRWPWPRSVLARLIEKLVAADAAVIGFDIVQSEGTTEKDLRGLRERVEGVDDRTWAAVRRALREAGTEDEMLAAAVRASKRTVLGYFFAMDQEGPAAEPVTVSTYNVVQHRPHGESEKLVKTAAAARANIPELTAAAREVGYFNFIPDPDGAYRRIPLAIEYGNEVALPLSLAMLRVYQPESALAIRFAESGYGVESLRIGSLRIPVAEDGQMLINYRGPGKTFTHLSAADVLAGRMVPERLRGKLVLVGVTAHAVTDVRVTPFDGEMPGVEIHANVLDNILRQDFIWQPRSVVLIELPVILLSVVMLGVALQYVRGAAAAACAGGLLAGYLVGSQWLFVSYGLPLSLVYPLLAIFLTYTAISIDHYVTEEREKRRNRTYLELYLTPSVARLLSDRPEMLKVGGEERELTVLFSDIRGFATVTERLGAGVVEPLNAYFGEMTEVIFAHEGMLDKFIGDAIMAVWGAPMPQADHAARACAAALGMVRRLRELEDEFQRRGWPILEIGIGLNTGPMVFGNIGSVRKLSFTVMGDNVNLGSRLEGLNKHYRCGIIASESTVRNAGDIVARELDLVQVKGRAQPVRIFEILAPGAERERWSLLLERFNLGLCAYRQQRWDDATAAFRAVLDERPGDGPATLYLERCRSMLLSPPPPGWDGVTVMEVK